MAETGTQTSTTVIAPVVKRKHWQWRSTELYHQLVKEEEEEGSDQEASPLARKHKEKAIEVIQEAETTPSLTLTKLQNVQKNYSFQPGKHIAAWLLKCWDAEGDSQELRAEKPSSWDPLLGNQQRNQKTVDNLQPLEVVPVECEVSSQGCSCQLLRQLNPC